MHFLLLPKKKYRTFVKNKFKHFVLDIRCIVISELKLPFKIYFFNSYLNFFPKKSDRTPNRTEFRRIQVFQITACPNMASCQALLLIKHQKIMSNKTFFVQKHQVLLKIFNSINFHKLSKKVRKSEMYSTENANGLLLKLTEYIFQ